MARFSIKARLNSVADAFKGIGHLISQEHNARIHVVATLSVISLGYYHAISFGDWISLVIAMSMVWLAEGLNTAVELLADAVSQEQNTLIGKAKDVAAGAVLLAAIGAAVIGALVFYPYF